MAANTKSYLVHTSEVVAKDMSYKVIPNSLLI